MQTEEKERYFRAAVECMELARVTQDEPTRARLVALVRKWLELADYPSGKTSLPTLLEAFNIWQMTKKP